MQQLVKGVHKFQSEVFVKHKDLYTRLAKGQNPHTLFITCSDSRINPNLLTQTEPGDIFILRNAGNLVPSYGAIGTSEAATVEYAVMALGVKAIVVCGHTFCGVMKALMNPKEVDDLPAVRTWLHHAEATRRIVLENYPDKTPEEKLNIALQENVLAQIESLRTHPTVAARLASGDLHIQGWVYKLESGEVFAYDSQDGQFHPVDRVEYKATARATVGGTLTNP